MEWSFLNADCNCSYKLFLLVNTLILSEIARLIFLDMKGKFETGLKFKKVGSKFDFFIIGVTMTCL